MGSIQKYIVRRNFLHPKNHHHGFGPTGPKLHLGLLMFNPEGLFFCKKNSPKPSVRVVLTFFVGLACPDPLGVSRTFCYGMGISTSLRRMRSSSLPKLHLGLLGCYPNCIWDYSCSTLKGCGGLRPVYTPKMHLGLLGFNPEGLFFCDVPTLKVKNSLDLMWGLSIPDFWIFITAWQYTDLL